LSGFLAADNVTATYTRAPGENAGTYAISATLSPSGVLGNYLIPSNPGTFTIFPANQAITFGTLSDQTFGAPDFPVSATASSGLAVTFTASGSCTVTGNTVHLTATGLCTITAHQVGGGNYNQALDLPRSFTVYPGATAVTGAVAKIDPPATVALGAFESDTTISLFLERASLTLTANALVSIVGPGLYPPDLLTESGTVAAGMVVDTYFLHADQVGTTGTTPLTGSVTFDTDVLGIQTGNAGDGLVSQSNALGHPGTTYTPTTGAYELGACPSSDTVTLSPDRRTVTVCTTTGTAADDLRIIVKGHTSGS